MDPKNMKKIEKVKEIYKTLDHQINQMKKKQPNRYWEETSTPKSGLTISTKLNQEMGNSTRHDE